MSRKHIVGLDLGTTKVCVVVARSLGGSAEVMGMGVVLPGRGNVDVGHAPRPYHRGKRERGQPLSDAAGLICQGVR